LRRIIALVSFLLGLAALPQGRVSASPDPLTCQGYPEPRVFAESNAWWTRFPGQTGTEFGHVHEGACIPERQTFDHDFDIDLRLMLHDNPGTFAPFDLVTKGVNYETTVRSIGVPDFSCPVGTCERWLHFTVFMSDFAESGLQEVRFRSFVDVPDGHRMHASLNWQLYISNGKPRSDVTRFPFFRGKGWYSPVNGVTVGYCEADDTDPLPEAPISGIWTPHVRIQNHDASLPVTGHFVALDPDFHMEPPMVGTVLEQGAGTFEGPVSIATTKLSNGRHKLFMRADCDAGTSTNSGVGAIFFTVANAVSCPTDFSGDGITDAADITLMLGSFGMVDSRYDLNMDGFVDVTDITRVTAQFGKHC